MVTHRRLLLQLPASRILQVGVFKRISASRKPVVGRTQALRDRGSPCKGVTGVVGTHKGCRCSGASVVLPRHVVEHLLVRGRSVSAFLWWASRRSSLEICPLWRLFILLRTSAPVTNLLPRAKTWWLSKPQRDPSFCRVVLGTSADFLHHHCSCSSTPPPILHMPTCSLLSLDIDINS